MGTSYCSSVPKNFLSSWSVGGSRKVALGTTHACFLSGVHWVSPLHVLAGGGGMVAGGAHRDEDLPLVEEDLVPAFHLGLPQGRSRLNAQAVLGGEGYKNGEVVVPL